MEDQTIGLASGRTVGFADYGIPDATAVLWCHGGPGSRLEPAYLRREASQAGLGIIGIDRPGHGLSAPQPGGTIAGWVPGALAVADQLGIGQFAAVGISTGGAFALALPALAPERVLGVVACCSMTDMRRPEGRATISGPHVRAVREAPDRAAALAAATDAHGEDGSKIRGEIAGVLPPSDLALFGDPGWMQQATAGFPAMCARGLQGYTDDRLADGAGWVTFDVRSIQCPVTVLHGGSDRMVDVIHAHHTAEVVPGANLVIFDDHGHFSIVTKVVPAISNLLQRSRRSAAPASDRAGAQSA